MAINIFENKIELADSVVKWLVQISAEAINERGTFHIALAGGSTPKAIYQLMSSNKYCDKFKWENIKVYFGDERTVPHDHEDSNYKMANEALLAQVELDSVNVFPIPTQEATAKECAHQYEELLRNNLPLADDGYGVFDVVLLGMGDDGHTASLFPGTSILDEQENWVAGVFVEKLDTWRISITFPLINHARNVAVLVTGDSKAGRLKEILVSKVNRYPIERVSPVSGVQWNLDSDAASQLSS